MNLGGGVTRGGKARSRQENQKSVHKKIEGGGGKIMGRENFQENLRGWPRVARGSEVGG